MKGVVFTEFLEMVEAQWGVPFLQQVIDDADLPSRGVYASTGVYPHSEMSALLTALSARTGERPSSLLIAFGEHLFGRFCEAYPGFFKGRNSAFDFLASVEREIHFEVKKLYPDAELPRIEAIEHSAQRLVLRYSSIRHMGDLCEGLIRGCLRHFDEKATITRREEGAAPAAQIDFSIERIAA